MNVYFQEILVNFTTMLLIAFILGVLYGRRVRRIDHPVVILLSGLALSLMFGPLPFYGVLYNNLPAGLSGVYLSALIGVVIGSETKERK